MENGQGYSVFDVINTIEKITCAKIKKRIIERRTGDPEKLIGSSIKAEEVLGWKPKYDLEEIIKTAWRWHQKKSI